jgi:hypothetical protein
MPIDAFPLHESLVRFFAADRRKPVALSRVAELLGVTTERLRSMLDSEGGTRNAGTLPWAEAAGYLFDAWPLARLLETLGPEHAHRVPRDLHPTRVAWSIPVFIVRAMEHQAAAESPGAARGVHDYVSDLLFNQIQPETVIAFRGDPAFLAAYHFPGEPGDE